MRAVGKESIVTAVIAVVVMYVASAVLLSGVGTSPGGNLLMAALAFAAGGGGIAYLVWIILVFVGNVVNRRRRRGWRIGTNILTALVVAVANTLVYVLLANDESQWAALASAIIALASGVFAVSAIAAVLLTYLVFLRPRPGAVARER